MELKIDKEIKNIIPPLTSEEYIGLEESIVAEGCRDAIVTWDGTIIDGHNRYIICQKHKIDFKTIEQDFSSKGEAILWVISNQLSRRNLTDAQRVEIALKHKEILTKLGKEKMEHSRDTQAFVRIEQTPPKKTSHDTRKKIAEISGVSEAKVQKVEKVLKEGDKQTKEKMLEGDISINKAYEETTGTKTHKTEEYEIVEAIISREHGIIFKAPYKWRCHKGDRAKVILIERRQEETAKKETPEGTCGMCGSSVIVDNKCSMCGEPYEV